ncbi:MAG: hypothetical protein SGJ02_03435, partial [bacterium]|nr:hypothetical protein [bacterium]
MSEAGLQTPNLNFWDPMSQLKRVSHREIEYSKGFLRAQLPQWLPGLAMQWLTLTHTLGVEVKIISVEPTLSIPNDFDVIFAGKIGQEDIGVGASQEALLTLAEACIPGAKNIAQGILQEYLARRFLSSVVLAWGGPQIPEFSFQGIRDVSQMSIAGSVILRLQINSVQCSVFIFLGSKTIDLLDGMWRRQIRSAAGQTKSPGEVHLELAQLAVK